MSLAIDMKRVLYLLVFIFLLLFGCVSPDVELERQLKGSVALISKPYTYSADVPIVLIVFSYERDIYSDGPVWESNADVDHLWFAEIDSVQMKQVLKNIALGEATDTRVKMTYLVKKRKFQKLDGRWRTLVAVKEIKVL